MSSPNLTLRVVSDRYSLTPLPYQVDAPCTGGEKCRNRATHRLLLLRDAAGVQLLCDAHTLEWAHGQGLRITTARLGDSAA